MTNKKKLIIFGLEDFAQIAYEYFTYDSEYEVVAFSAHGEYINEPTLMGLPIVPFEDIEHKYSPDEYSFYAAVTYKRLNEVRHNIYTQAKNKGYKLASYISSQAFVWKNAKLGEHIFIFENNVVQPFSEIGNNVILWSGNHIGHHSKIGDNCFISSHVAVSGWCNIGNNCFIGVNSSIANSIKIGSECWIGHASVISEDISSNCLVRSSKSDVKNLNKESLYKFLSRISQNRNNPNNIKNA